MSKTLMKGHMKTLAFFLLAFYSVPLYAGISVCYDQDGAVSHNLSSGIVSGCSYYEVDKNITLEQDLEIRGLFKNNPDRYIKEQNGLPVLKSPAEQVAADDALAADLDAQQSARDDRLEVTLEEAFTAFVQVVNLRLPAGQKITKAELVAKVKENRG